MQIRSLGVFTAAAMVLLASVIAWSSHEMIQRFDAIELSHASEQALKGLRALEADLNQLAVSTRDYAEWDDAQSYVATQDPAFLHANFSYDSLAGMQVDFLVIVDSQDQVLYAAQLDEAAHRLTPSVPPPVLEAVRKLHGRIPALRSAPSTERMLRMPTGAPVAFSIVEIARSDRSARTGAAMFFGRRVAGGVLTRARQTSRLPLQILSVDDRAGAAIPAADLHAWQRVASGAAAIDAVFTDGTRVTGYAGVKDFAGVPLLVASVREERVIGALGRRTTYLLMGAIALLVLICAALALLFMLRLRSAWSRQLAMRTHQQRVLACLDECIVVADEADGRIVDGNAAVLRLLGYSHVEFLQLTLEQICIDMPSPGPAPGGSVERAPRECRLRSADGHIVETEVNTTRLTDVGRAMICVVARDLTHRRQAEQDSRAHQSRLAHQLEHDALTGLPNRIYLQRRMPELLSRAAMQGQCVALIYVDIDHFQSVNMHGHDSADRALKGLAANLTRELQADSIVLRVGGDEFVVVAALPDAIAAKNLALRALAVVRMPLSIDGLSLTLSASAGIAVYPQDGLDGETLLKHADIALYQAKEQGQGTFRLFASDMKVRASEQVALEQALGRALNTGQIHIAYQPLVDLQTGVLVSFEALARWTHPELGPIPPNRFIPLAEKSGLIVPLGEQIVRDVIAQLSEWQAEGLSLAPVAINVAPMQFELSDFSNYVHETALQFDVDPKLLAFEVTESALMQNSSKHVVIIDTLRHAGSRVYIDDFGTGFSNLSYLKSLPVDAVKIDQSFVRDIDTDASDVAIVTGIIAMARQLRLTTIVEGVETAAQADRLRRLGCELGQGYYFSEPLAPASCRSLLKQLGTMRCLTETVKMRAFRQAAV